MWFRPIISDGWPVKRAQTIEIQDPSNELEVLRKIKDASSTLTVELAPRRDRVDLVIRDRESGAVTGHLVPCS